jgi:hypothetical protein
MNTREYLNLHKIDLLKKLNNEVSPKNPEFADFLYHNLDKMDTVEKYILLRKIITPRQTYHMLLEYEFWERKIEPKEMKLDELMSEIMKLINRYQWKTGGYNMGSHIWDKHLSGSKLCQVKDDEVWLTNTVPIKLINSETAYLKRLIDMINSLSTTFTSSLQTQKYYRDGAYMLIIVIKKIKI